MVNVGDYMPCCSGFPELKAHSGGWYNCLFPLTQYGDLYCNKKDKRFTKLWTFESRKTESNDVSKVSPWI